MLGEEDSRRPGAVANLVRRLGRQTSIEPGVERGGRRRWRPRRRPGPSVPRRLSKHAGRWVLVGSTAIKAPTGVVVCRRSSDLTSLVRESAKERVYVSYRLSSTDDLLKAGLKHGRGAHIGNLLALEPPRPESIPSLSGLFERVIGATPGYRWLPHEELPRVLSGKDAADRVSADKIESY